MTKLEYKQPIRTRLIEVNQQRIIKSFLIKKKGEMIMRNEKSVGGLDLYEVVSE